MTFHIIFVHIFILFSVWFRLMSGIVLLWFSVACFGVRVSVNVFHIIFSLV